MREIVQRRASRALRIKKFRVSLALLAATSAAAVLVAASGAGTAAARSGRSSSSVFRWGVVGNRGAISPLQLDVPTAVAGIPKNAGRVMQIATSNSDGYALTSTGAVYAWGVGSYGELGDGQLAPYDTRAARVVFPAGVRIRSLPDPMPFDAGLAIDSHRRVWGWGLDGEGDLCSSVLIERRPEQIPLSDVTLATGARTHSLFDAHGTVYACGSGDAGELGDGSTVSRSSPTRVRGLPADEKVVALTSSWEGSGALLVDGDYFDWGYNAAGQLGDGTKTDSAVPVDVKLKGPVTHVFQGGSGPKNGQTVAILKDGSVWDWGDNDYGQLGNGTRTSSATPIRLGIPQGVAFAEVSSGGFASYAIDRTGRLWDWGSNSEGQLGLASHTSIRTRPTDTKLHLTGVSSTAQNVAGFTSRR